jgi:tetratricopeptide (TPR) repeat protein
MKKLFLILSLLLLNLAFTYSQEYYQLEEMFLDADSWFTFEDYQEALPIFLKVNEADPENYNVIYKIGFCYLHIPGQKDKSISFLKKATERTTDSYRENTYIEKRAPIDAFFYLGNAYLVNNQIEQAIDSYLGFQILVSQSKKLANKDIYDKDYLDKQINACKNAIDFKNRPIEFIAANLGTPINTRFNDFNPVISGDGNMLVFTTKLKFYDAIFFSKKVNGVWGYPVNIMAQLGVDNKTATTSLSYDGSTLYLYRDDNFDGNIYVSYLKNGQWSNIVSLGENINTKYWESHASISKDGKKLYFTSNRPGGYGDLDIYVSEIQSDGKWGVPKNMGPNINSRWNENTPFITENEDKLFFCSEGHRGMGGYDVFYATKTGNEWSKPINIGYPLNSTDDNLFFMPESNGEAAYFSQFSQYGYGGQDIYKINLSNISKKSPIKVEAVLSMNNEVQKKIKEFTIHIIDTVAFDTIAILTPDKDLPEEQFRTPLGEDHLVYESNIRDENGIQYLISRNYSTKEVFLNPIITKKESEIALKTDSFPEISLDKDIYTTSSDDESVRIKLSLQKGNKLFVSTFYNENLINSEEFDINKKEDFIYEYKPKEGESKIRFKLIDEHNNIKTQEVTVSYVPQDKDAHMKIAGKVINLADGQKDIKIRLSVEKDSKLYVQTYVDGVLINTETFDIDQESFTYQYEPKGDKSKINFKLVDKYNNIKNEEVVVSHTPISQDLADLLKGISTFNSKGFEELLSSPGIQSAKTIQELMALLYSEGLKSGVSEKQIDALIIALAISYDIPTVDFIKKLHSLAQGNLKQTLDTILMNQANFKTNLAVVQYLSEKATQNGYTENDIIRLLKDYISQSEIDVKKALTLLNKMIQTDISSILANLDAGAIDIVTIQDFIKHFERRNIYSPQETELIYALLEGIYLTTEKSKPIVQPLEAEDAPIAAQQKTTNVLLFVIICFVGLGIIIFVFYRTKKNRKSKEKKFRI